MKPHTEKSPLALTADMAAVLRTITLTPLLDLAGIVRECGDVAPSVSQLVNRGLALVRPGQKRDGRVTSLYTVTLKGMQALDRHTPLPRQSVAVPPTTLNPLRGYTCPELGRTCQRPGAYDAFALPSLIGRERRMPQGAL